MKEREIRDHALHLALWVRREGDSLVLRERYLPLLDRKLPNAGSRSDQRENPRYGDRKVDLLHG
jgi:hypothetical protein